MAYYTVQEAKTIVLKIRAKGVYNPAAKSARCPLCGAWGLVSNRNIRKLPYGKIRRYFVCPDCGHKFSSEN